MDSLRQDLRWAARQLLKSPGFTVMAVVTLALGIGATTAVFSVVHAVLLRPLPYERPDELVQIWETNPQRVAERGLPYTDIGVNALNYLEYRDEATSFAALGYILPYADDGRIQIGGGEGRPERVAAWAVSGSVFTVLGVPPLLGRVFTEEERAPPGQMRWTEVVVLSHRLWQRRYGGDPDIIGRRITLEAGPATVVGVMPPGFQIPPIYEYGSVVYREADIYIPLFYQAFEQPRRFRQFKVIGRLAPGVPLERARAEVAAVAARLEAAYPESNTGWTAVVTPLHTLLARDYGQVLWLLMGAVGFVLLVACANVANLMLVRGAARRAELGVRAALGGTRRRLARQVLAESALIAVLGGAAGLLLAAVGTDALLTQVPAGVARATESGLDRAVLAFTAGVSLFTAMLFGLLPALRASRVQPLEAIRSAAKGTAAGRVIGRVPRALVGMQVGLALLLLAGGGLLMKSFLRLQGADAGFDAPAVLIASIHLGAHDPLTGFAMETPEERAARKRRRFAFTNEMIERVRGLPGVVAAATTGEPPFEGTTSLWPIITPEQFAIRQGDGQIPPEEQRFGLVYQVSPDYFRTLGIPILRGSGFPPWDGVTDWERYEWHGGCSEHVADCIAIVSETLARTMWPGEDPIGKKLGIYDCCVTVVGVVADATYRGVDDPPLAQLSSGFQMYLPFAGSGLLVRTEGSPLAVSNAVREVIASLAPEAAVSFSTLEGRMAESLARPRFYVLMIGIFAATALLLALVGLYGVVVYATRERTREIGLRMALGAARRDVLLLVVRQGMVPVLAGIAAGGVAAFALRRLLAALLYGMEPTDPALMGGLAAALALAALAATLVPARWASRIPPMEALRSE